jgi:hypothetical protein
MTPRPVVGSRHPDERCSHIVVTGTVSDSGDVEDGVLGQISPRFCITWNEIHPGNMTSQ